MRSLILFTIVIGSFGANSFAAGGRAFLEVFESPQYQEFPVYDKPNPNPEIDEPVMFLKPGDLLPLSRAQGGNLILERQGGKPLYLPQGYVRETRQPEGKSPYLDGQLGTPYTLTSQPGKTYQDCWELENNNNANVPCKAWPTAGDNTAQLKLEEARLVSFFDPIEGRDVTRIFYRTSGWYLPKKSTGKGGYSYETEKRTFTSLWVDSKNIRYSPLNRQALLSPCPPDGLRNREQKQPRQLEEIARAIDENSYKAILPHVGDCLNGRGGVASLRQHWRQKNSATRDPALRIGRQAVSGAELEAIDVLARTLYGEMRGCANMGIRYPMAVAKVALNRADLALSPRADSSIFPLPARRPSSANHQREEALINVIATPKQFSALNPNDRNLGQVMCPAKPSRQKANDLSLEAWKKSVNVAAQAILNPQEFKDKTQDIKVFHYTSAMAAPWRGAKKVTANVDGYPLDNASCIRLWQVGSASKFTR